MLDEFREVQDSLHSSGVRGWWERAKAQLPEDKWDALLAAGADRTISHRAISMVLERWGVKVSAVQVGHWRRTQVWHG